MRTFAKLAVFLFLMLTLSILATQIRSEQAGDTLPACVGDLLGDSTPTTLASAVTALLDLRTSLHAAGNKADEADALYCLGLSYYAQGQYRDFEQPFRDARIQFQRALVAYRDPSVQNRAGEARSLLEYGRSYFVLRDFSNTLPNYQQALRTAQAINDIAILSDVEYDLGMFYLDSANPSHDLDKAEFQLQQAYAGYLRTQNLERQADTQMTLAETEFAMSKFDIAANDFEAAANVFQKLDNTQREADARYGSASILFHIGDLYGAEDALNAVLVLYQTLQDRAGEGHVDAMLGSIYQQRGYSIARDTLEEAVSISSSIGDNVGQSIAMSYLGEEIRQEGDLDRALSTFTSALQLADTAKDQTASALAHLGRARVHGELASQHREPILAALDDFGEATRLYRDIMGDYYALEQVFISQAWALFRVDNSSKTAYDLFFEARNKAHEIGDQRGEANALFTLGQVYTITRDYERAAGFLGDASALSETIGDHILTGDIYVALGDIAVKRAMLSSARERFQTALDNYRNADEEVKAALMSSRLGEIDQRLGSYREALDYYRSVLATLQGYQNPRSDQQLIDHVIASSTLALGSVYLDLKLYPPAQQQLTNALNLLENNRDDFDAASARVYLGDVAFAQHNYGVAGDFYRQASRDGQRAENFHAQALAMAGTGSVMVAAKTGTELEIQGQFEGALALVRQVGDADGERRILTQMGEAAVTQRDLNQAVTYFSSARTVAERIQDQRNAASITLRLAYVYSLNVTDRTAVGATQSYQDAIRRFRAVNDPAGEALGQQGLGDIALRRSRYTDALDAFSAMKAADENANYAVGQAIALTRLGQTYQDQKLYNLALTNYNAAENILNYDVDSSDELIDQTALEIAKGEMYRARGTAYMEVAQIDTAKSDLGQAQSVFSNSSLFSDSQLSLTLIGQADVSLKLRDFDTARSQLEQAQDIAERVKDDYADGLALYGTARVLSLDNRLVNGTAANLIPANRTEANRLFDLSLNLFRTRVPNPRIALQILISRADAYRGVADYENARTWYRTAVNDAIEYADPIGQGYAQLALGDLRADRFLFEDAINDYKDAISQFTLVNDWLDRGEGLYRLAEIALTQVDYPSAMDHYQEALAMYEAAETSADPVYRPEIMVHEAETLTRIGEAYQRQERLALALNQHFQALSRLQDARDLGMSDSITAISSSTEARIQRNLGIARLSMGQLDEADGSLKTALSLTEQSGDILQQATTHQIIGQLEFTREHYQFAIDNYHEAEADFEKVNLPQLQGELLINLADAFSQLALNAMLHPQRSNNDPTPTAMPDTSDESFDPTLPPDTLPANSNTSTCGQISGSATTNFSFLTVFSCARIDYQRALEIARTINDPVMEVHAQQGLGRVFDRTGDNIQGGKYLVAALNLVQSIEQVPLQASILVDLGLIAEENHDVNLAINYYTQAVKLFEDVYSNIRLEPGQIAFASQNILPYHRLVALYAKTDPAMAFAYAERSRARTLLYQLGTEQIDFGVSASADLLAEWQSKRGLVRNLYQSIQDNVNARATEPNADTRNRLLDENAKLTQDIAGIEQSLSSLQEEIDTQNAVLAQVTQVNPHTIDEIKQTLNLGTDVLSYYIVPPSSVDTQGSVYAFIVGHDQFKMQTLHVTPEALRQGIEDNLDGVRNLDQVSQLFVDLYADLVTPIQSDLTAPTVVVVPHGVLNAVPFAALTPDRQTYFGDQHTLVYSPSATFFSLLRTDRAASLGNIQGSAIVYGDPTTIARVPSTSNLRGTTLTQLPVLPKAAEEARQVATLLGVPNETGDAATESELWVNAPSKKLIHIAAHGVFNPNNPLASFLTLAGDKDNDGSLQVREIYSMNLQENQPLVVLSACDSAVGGEVESDDVQSLSRAFLISGARSVIATLWRVDDAATEALVLRFYGNLLNEHMTVAQALSSAQAYIRSQPQWSAPRYWAGFVLEGLPE